MGRRLTVVIHALHGGGAERTAAELANLWSQRSHTVSFITLGSDSEDTYPLDPAVQRASLGLMRPSRNVFQAVSNNVKRKRELRRAIVESNPDLVVSFTDKMNILTLLATRRSGIPVVVAERTDPRQQSIGPVWSRLRRWLYPSCAAAVVQTEPSREFIAPLVKGRPVHVIPNAVREPAARLSHSPDSMAQQQVVWLGRLSREKGPDLMVRAFSEVSRLHPGWKLTIAGEGPLREEVEGLIRELNLTECVRLLGWTAEPADVLRQADIFVLSSRYEGFPNALLEAMAVGLPAVSFDCPSGPRAIIRDKIDGLLTPAEDVDGLAAAIGQLISDPALRLRLGERAKEVCQRFSVERNLQQWDEVIESVAIHKRP